MTEPVRLVGAGLVLRGWEERDLPVMVELFDDDEVARWTPLPTPFTLEQARARLERAHRGEPRMLAVTTDGDEPLGEVMVMSTGHLGYVIGPRHRGRGLAVRAVVLIRDHAHEAMGHDVLRLQISAANEASNLVARRACFRLVPGEDEVVVDKGRTHRLQTWEHRRA